MEYSAEHRQVKSLKRIIKNLDKEITSLILEKNTLITAIDILNAKLKNLLTEIEQEKSLSKEFLIFEFDKFFELSKIKMQKITEENEFNKSQLNSLISTLKEKYDEQKKYENLLDKSTSRIKHFNNLSEQKNLDELAQQRYNSKI
jgi:flagellar biosynthesis chaperone FliJ